MNIKDIRALLTRLDHSDNGRDIRDMHVEMKGVGMVILNLF